ncbi:MAG: ATP-binding protein [Acidovorax sp.]|uniref:ATP-binding protein n=1 Tax=Acidovorax sp. TaxID=1872122 RepID=UPI00391D2DA7
MQQPNLFSRQNPDIVVDVSVTDAQLEEELATQFRLRHIQTFNWGTFPGLVDFPVPATGYLFVGPSGSGKSTVLDAHAALTTPPKWVDFNVAAAESDRHGKDRNLATYVRGAWGQQTGEGEREYVRQFLRGGKTTWSAIAETYKSKAGKIVSLAQVLWIRGAGAAHTDVKRWYVVAEREFDVREFQAFAEADFDVRKLRATVLDAYVKDEFPPYQERFRHLLGIDTERALRLLHKTQSAKNLGDLNEFLREFMLDPPQTVEVANRLVADFKELRDAHAAVVSAKRQIETLQPARVAYEERDILLLRHNELSEVRTAVPMYREQRRVALLKNEMSRLTVELEACNATTISLERDETVNAELLRNMRIQHTQEGGGVLEDLRAKLKAAEDRQPEVVRKKEQMGNACAKLNWSRPGNPEQFVTVVDQARAFLEDGGNEGKRIQARRDKLRDDSAEVNRRVRELDVEIQAMERQPSNIPGRLLEVRRRMALALKIGEDKLPFAGELLQVKVNERAWTGAIERVLHGLGTSLLVSDHLYEAVFEYLESVNTGQRLVYLRTIHHVSVPKTVSPNSLYRKLDVAQHPHQEWLREELKSRYDYECVDSQRAFREAVRAVTMVGQVKRSAQQHEKDDRSNVNDMKNWVLGFSNEAKLKLYKAEASEGVEKLLKAQKDIEDIDKESSTLTDRLLSCQVLANLIWSDVDVEALLNEIAHFRNGIRRETDLRPNLEQLNRDITEQEERYNESVRLRQESASLAKEHIRDYDRWEKKLSEIKPEHLSVQLTPYQQTRLNDQFAELPAESSLDNLDKQAFEVDRNLSVLQTDLNTKALEAKALVEKCLADFARGWEVETGGLDPVIASAPDFLAKLAHLESDGLPKFEANFLKLLHQQSDQNLTELMAKLNNESKAIQQRLEQVNEGLRTAPFNKGTYLHIRSMDKATESVREFKQLLKRALDKSFQDDTETAKERFEVLAHLVKRLSSQESEELRWKSLVLDVRQHFEFAAHELREDDGGEEEVFLSGAGKSGGQRQKLTATCLAAALRYQLGGVERRYPTFSTVVLDEAFDKADSEFTALAMNIFKELGFQMVIATPLKNVMALEPFIGGASFVHFLKEEKHSVTLKIEYDEEQGRLLLSDKQRDAAAEAQTETMEETSNGTQEFTVA